MQYHEELTRNKNHSMFPKIGCSRLDLIDKAAKHMGLVLFCFEIRQLLFPQKSKI